MPRSLMSRKYKQFDQYQQNEPYPLTSSLWTQKQTTTYVIGNPCAGLGMFWKLQVKCEIILQGRKLDFKHLFYNNLADELSVTKAFPQNWPFKVVVLVTVCAKCRWSRPTKWDVSPPVMLSFPVWMSGFVNYLRQGMCDRTGNCIKKNNHTFRNPCLPHWQIKLY